MTLEEPVLSRVLFQLSGFLPAAPEEKSRHMFSSGPFEGGDEVSAVLLAGRERRGTSASRTGHQQFHFRIAGDSFS